MTSSEAEAISFANDDPSELRRRLEAVGAELKKDRPTLGADGWRRAAFEQLLHRASSLGLGPQLAPWFPEKAVDHGLDDRRVLQALAAFETDGRTFDRCAFLLAVLNGEKAVIDACGEYLKLGAIPKRLYEGPFDRGGRS